MGGKPWLRLAVVLMGFTLMGFPVWQLTQGRGPVPPPAALAPPDELKRVALTLTFSQVPAEFRLTHLGQSLLEKTPSQTSYALVWTVGIPPEGLDLLLVADWPDTKAQKAVRVEITQNGLPCVDRTFWAEGDLVELITVPGN
jgi:hypothetical protein